MTKLLAIPELACLGLTWTTLPALHMHLLHVSPWRIEITSIQKNRIISYKLEVTAKWTSTLCALLNSKASCGLR